MIFYNRRDKVSSKINSIGYASVKCWQNAQYRPVVVPVCIAFKEYSQNKIFFQEKVLTIVKRVVY